MYGSPVRYAARTTYVSATTMHRQLEMALRTGPHGKRVNFLLGPNPASHEALARVRALLAQ